ncbi:MAG: helix-turn-helix domain-containing protein [Parcubacteria group bacterium]
MASNRNSSGTPLEAEDAAIDALIGANIKLRRTMIGATQSDLANALGLTFQQVQKYETGRNRVSGSTLWRIAAFLGCNVADLYAGATAPNGVKGPGVATAKAAVIGFLAQDGALELAEAFGKVPGGSRRSLINLAVALAR